MEFESLLEEVGGFGTHQKRLLVVFLVPISFFVGCCGFMNVFALTTPKHWCHVPDLDILSLTKQQRRELVSADNDASCYMKDVNYLEIMLAENSSAANSTEVVYCRNGWEYDTTFFESTIVTEWNLVCERSHYPSLSLSIQSAGALLLFPMYGSLSDRFGRRRMLSILLVAHTFTGILTLFSINLPMFVTIQTINQSMIGSLFILPLILVSELVSPNMRATVNCIQSIAYALGSCTMPLSMYLLNNWRKFLAVDPAFSIFLLLLWKWYPESPTWLISKKKYVLASKLMTQIAKENKKCFEDTDIFKKIQHLGEERQKQSQKIGFWKSFVKYSQIRKHFILLSIGWILIVIVYFGSTYNTINLSGNIFISIFLMSIFELPGAWIATASMDRYGRRWTNVAGFLATALACLLPLIGFPFSDVVSSVLIKLLGGAVYVILEQQSCELFPTVLRTFGMMATRVPSMAFRTVLPYVIILGAYDKEMPFLLATVICLLGAFVVSFLPETGHKNLPQTMMDAEELGINQKFFSFIRMQEKKATKPEKSPAEEKCLQSDEQENTIC